MPTVSPGGSGSRSGLVESSLVARTGIRLVVKVVAEIVERRGSITSDAGPAPESRANGPARGRRRSESFGSETSSVLALGASPLAARTGSVGSAVQQLLDQVAPDPVVFDRRLRSTILSPRRGQVEDETGLGEPQPVPAAVEASRAAIRPRRRRRRA